MLTSLEEMTVREAQRYVEHSNFSNNSRVAKLIAIIKRLTTPITVNYDDEVAAEQVKTIDEKLKPEFADFTWETVEKE